ncbi:hypothetical protein BJY01DRAFT_256404 [Aspergillus pseudoustus]|uniref:Uncharacterized protein n=1 Tax=Aspergillus pseudoustus TaxID=1810923 RepID=A0ABR4IAQ5_9EURO
MSVVAVGVQTAGTRGAPIGAADTWTFETGDIPLYRLFRGTIGSSRWFARKMSSSCCGRRRLAMVRVVVLEIQLPERPPLLEALFRQQSPLMLFRIPASGTPCTSMPTVPRAMVSTHTAPDGRVACASSNSA